jgi:hypothetical protein
MQPASHRLEARWWVFPAGAAPAPATFEDRDGTRPRSGRGPLSPIDAEPLEEHSPKKGVSEFQLSVGDLDPGLYRVVCRARDTTEIRGEKTPWVLRDEAGVLESERGWWVQVD